MSSVGEMFLVTLAVTLAFVASSPTRRSPDPGDTPEGEETPDLKNIFNPPEDEASLNEMFREVEQLMEDTQNKLKDAVKEMQGEETAEDSAALKDLPPNYHNESIKETQVGNDTILTREEIDKKTDNITGSTFLSDTVESSLSSGIIKSRECMVDEDCTSSNYCHLSRFNYECKPCREQEQTCTRDAECCDEKLCVWGQCKESTEGEEGTICETQRDCDYGLCCAIHRDLLFPVCTPIPTKGQKCHNPLLDVFVWQSGPDSPVRSCPCSYGLVCQSQGNDFSSVCEKPSANGVKKDHQPETIAEYLALATAMYEEPGMWTPAKESEDNSERVLEYMADPHSVDED